MKSIVRNSIVWMVALLSMSAVAQSITPKGEWIKPSNEGIQYVGRISFKHPDSPAFTYPGTQIIARF